MLRRRLAALSIGVSVLAAVAPSPSAQGAVTKARGPLLGTIRLPSAINIVGDARARHLYVTGLTSNGVTIIDAQHMRITRQVKTGTNAGEMAYDQPSNSVMVVNQIAGNVFKGGPGSVSFIDATTGRNVGRVIVGMDPEYILDLPALGRAMVTNTSANSVSIIDTIHRRVIKTVHGISMYYAQDGLMAAIGPSGPVMVSGNDGVYAVSASGERLGHSRLSFSPVDMLYDTQDHELYLADSGTIPHPGHTIVAFDPATGRGFKTGVCTDPESLAYDRGTRQVVTLCGDRNGKAFILDATTGKLRRVLTVGRLPASVVVDHRLHRAYALNAGSDARFGDDMGADTVTIIDLRQDAVIGTVVVGHDPLNAWVDDARARVYIANAGDHLARRGLGSTDAGVTVLDAAYRP